MSKKSFKIRGNLAQALDDTMNAALNNSGELHVEIVPLRKIVLDEENPRELAITLEDVRFGLNKDDPLYTRKQNEKESLASLVTSIQEHFLINPILVFKDNETYKVIAGERRTLASVLAGKDDIPAKILTYKPNPLKQSLLQWIENQEREDLSLWERLKNLEKIFNSFGQESKKSMAEIMPAEIGRLLGCSIQQGVNYKHLLSASEKLKNLIRDGKITNIEKAAFISKHSPEYEDIMIAACLNGATLKELSKIQTTTPPKEITGKTKNNRVIRFGNIELGLAKTIIQCVIENPRFSNLSATFKDIKLEDEQSIQASLKLLLKRLKGINDL